MNDLKEFHSQERILTTLQRMYQLLGKQDECSDDREKHLDSVRDALAVQYAIVMAARWKLYYQESKRYHRPKGVASHLEELVFLSRIYWERLDPSLKVTHKRVLGRHLKTKQRLSHATLTQDLFANMIHQNQQKEYDAMGCAALRARCVKVTRTLLKGLVRNRERTKTAGETGLVRPAASASNTPDIPPSEIEPLNRREKRIKHGWKKTEEDESDGENEEGVVGAGSEVLSWKKTKVRTKRHRAHKFHISLIQ